jgi:hypothetical protein
MSALLSNIAEAMTDEIVKGMCVDDALECMKAVFMKELKMPEIKAANLVRLCVYCAGEKRGVHTYDVSDVSQMIDIVFCSEKAQIVPVEFNSQ